MRLFIDWDNERIIQIAANDNGDDEVYLVLEFKNKMLKMLGANVNSLSKYTLEIPMHDADNCPLCRGDEDVDDDVSCDDFWEQKDILVSPITFDMLCQMYLHYSPQDEDIIMRHTKRLLPPTARFDFFLDKSLNDLVCTKFRNNFFTGKGITNV